MGRAWLPLYVGDYLRDTRDLNTLQHGAYLLLIMHYWQHDALPTDDARLAAIAGLPVAQWRRIREPVQAKFAEGWRHKRIEAELAKLDRAVMQRQTPAATAASNPGSRARSRRASHHAGATGRQASACPKRQRAGSGWASGREATANQSQSEIRIFFF